MTKATNTFLSVRAILERFAKAGCVINTAEPSEFGPDGWCSNVRYVVNPANGAFVALVDLADDEAVSAEELAYWERRLGVIPKKPAKPSGSGTV